MRRVAGAFVVFATLCAVSGAEAQTFKSFRDKIFGKPVEDGRSSQAVPKVAHFVSEDGESFIFDSSQSIPLLRFDGDDEVFALTATAGTRGDIIYKNDMGQPVLKATRWGGMVLFSDGRPMGDPVAVKGKADNFQPSRMSPEQLWLHLAKCAYRASRSIEHKVLFNADADTPGDSTITLFADAATVASDALIQASEQSDARHALDGLHEVRFVEGRPPSAHFDNGVLVLKLDPSRGTWGGHVSSKRIVKVLSASFSLAVGH
ncbi:DUF4908 domain-containing protein [Asticcacaulis solisilvae]|uniref:DUF4908 domain-containing protein n=1 Tax=Asticcacaulis solisilvae TaxID=1217274 RepID=UPI003FD71D7D